MLGKGIKQSSRRILKTIRKRRFNYFILHLEMDIKTIKPRNKMHFKIIIKITFKPEWKQSSVKPIGSEILRINRHTNLLVIIIKLSCFLNCRDKG